MIILPQDATRFEINGTEYFKQEDMSVARYEYFDELWSPFIYGINFAALQSRHIEIENTLVKEGAPLRNIVDAANMLGNIRMHIPSPTAASQIQIALEICALIFNTKDEDVTKLNHEIINDKKEAFKNCNASFFLLNAASLIPTLLKHWEQLPEVIEKLRELTNMEYFMNSNQSAPESLSTEL